MQDESTITHSDPFDFDKETWADPASQPIEPDYESEEEPKKKGKPVDEMAPEERAYHELVLEGLKHGKDEDTARLRYGYCVAKLEIIEGHHTIDEYAKDTNKSRAYAFRAKQFVLFYPYPIIEKYLRSLNDESPLTYTQMVDAMTNNSLEQAISWLDKWWSDQATEDQSAFEVATKADPETGGGSAWHKEFEDTGRFDAIEKVFSKIIKETGANPDKICRVVLYTAKD